jgi:DNA-binding CsgD family transcriptional regulator
MDLLERESILSELDALLRDAAAGSGRIAAVAGEAGVGKTSLVEHFSARHARTARTLRGLCDSLATPRPLGPVHDMAAQTSGPLADALRAGVGRDGVFSALLEEIGRPPVPRIVLVEDVHWADDATLDLLRFIGRRIRQVPALLVVTYRDDEVGPTHPLHQLLGQLPQAAVRWMRLSPLSEEAVRELARRGGRPAEGVYALTGGNPFFVTEVLASGGATVPVSIREAVLARAARLSDRARELLDLVAIAPGRMERRLLDALVADAPALVRECAASGALTTAPDAVGFRHELARLAWLEALEPGAHARLHARVLHGLLERPVHERDIARVVHHADGAGDGECVLRVAPAAAREAAAAGAHRQAEAHYRTALRYADRAPPAMRAELLDAWSYELHLCGRIADAVRAREEALALWRRVGDRRREGDALRQLSRLAWFEGRRAAAAAHAAEAIRVLEPLGPSHELAMAYSTRAQLHILAEERKLAPEWGDRAVAMAEALGDPEALVHALTNAACLTPGGARENQLRAARLAQEHGFHEHAMRAFTWLICDAIVEHDHALAEGVLPEALAYAEAHDLDAFISYLRGWRARMRVQQGRLDEAEADATDVLRREHTSTVERLPALGALGTALARRGDPGARALLDEALERAESTGELQRLAPVANARAEAAWLRGDLEGMRAEAMRAYPLALQVESWWDAGRLAVWLGRAGALDEVPAELPGPFAAELAGRWRDAVRSWERLGCPYEQALALAEGDDAEAWQESFAILDALGAHAAAAAVRRDLQRRGARGIPRGPRPATRRNPAGLTPAQARVLALLARGLSNTDIARELSVSPRTVDHHVSAVLGKLEVATRAAAIAAAHERGLLVTR